MREPVGPRADKKSSHCILTVIYFHLARRLRHVPPHLIAYILPGTSRTSVVEEAAHEGDLGVLGVDDFAQQRRHLRTKDVQSWAGEGA